jgi:isochorismate hydrolase
MGIPAIEPYPLPTEGELPVNTARWALDTNRAVLLIHDMQRYFLRPFPADESPATDLVANAVLLRERCAELGIPVAYTAQPGSMTTRQRGLLNDFWGPGMTIDPQDRLIIDELAPRDGDTILVKWRYSAFFNTELRELMLRAGRDQLIVCGVYAHVGVLMTCCDAFTFDIEPFLVADAVADFSEAYHRLAVDYAAERCAMTVTTKNVLRDLS